MTNQEKDELRRLIKHEIKMGRDIQEATAKLKQFGYSVTTIKRYYRAFATRDITKVIQDLIIKYNKTPAEINAGLCEEFAEDVIKQMGGHSEDITDMAMPIESKYFGHVWIKYKGKHYDALHPYGVENWKDLFETEKTKDHRFGE